jgi:hypothetical protein
LRIRQPADEAIFISLNTNRLLRHKKHSLPAVCLPPACRLPAGKGRAKAGQRQGKGRLAMTYSYILTLGMLADNHIFKISISLHKIGTYEEIGSVDRCWYFGRERH